MYLLLKDKTVVWLGESHCLVKISATNDFDGLLDCFLRRTPFNGLRTFFFVLIILKASNIKGLQNFSLNDHKI